MSEFEIRQSIRQAIDDMTLAQQMKLLEFINAMLAKPKQKQGAGILQFAGIFDKKDTREFQSALEDCRKIDESEW